MTQLAVGLREAGDSTGISQHTLRRMVKSGRLQAVRVGRRILIPISELEKLMKPGAVSQTGRKNT